MNMGFTVVVCLLVLMITIIESADIWLFGHDNFFRPWIYGILSFYALVVIIVHRIVPLLKEFRDLFKKGSTKVPQAFLLAIHGKNRYPLPHIERLYFQALST